MGKPGNRNPRPHDGRSTRFDGTTLAERQAITAAARAAWRSRWADMVDPEGVLPEAQRAALADEVKRTHMAAMGRLQGRRARLSDRR